MIFQYSLQDVEKQLEEDTHDNYKTWLINELKQYKKMYEERKINTIPHWEAAKIEHMLNAIDAAICIIKSKKHCIGQACAFNGIF